MKYAIAFALVFATMFCSPSFAQQSGPARDALEKQLSELDQKWMAAERDRKMDFLNNDWTTDFFDIVPGGNFATKADMIKMFNDTPKKEGAGAYPNDFKLRAVYGNVAIATDHTTIKGFGAVDGEYRCIRMFVKENGKWRPAGSAIVAIEKH